LAVGIEQEKIVKPNPNDLEPRFAIAFSANETAEFSHIPQSVSHRIRLIRAIGSSIGGSEKCLPLALFKQQRTWCVSWKLRSVCVSIMIWVAMIEYIKITSSIPSTLRAVFFQSHSRFSRQNASVLYSNAACSTSRRELRLRRTQCTNQLALQGMHDLPNKRRKRRAKNFSAFHLSKII